MNLKQKALSGLLWDYSGQVINMVITFATAVLLSRFLEPEMFGLIGMVSIFTTLAYMLTNFGFGSALIQDQHVSNKDLSTVFYFNIVLGLLLTMLLFVLAPVISTFFNQPALVKLIKFMSLTFLISSLNIIPISLLSKDINYKAQMLVEITAAFGGGLFGIIMALNGFGVWSIATQILTLNLIKTGLLWYVQKWRPSLEFDIDSLRRLLGYGSKIFGSQAIATFFAQLDNLIIGKLFSASVLGYYTRGKRFQELPVQSFSFALRVFFPVLSKMQDDQDRMRSAVLKSTKMVAFLVFPMMAGVIILAEPMVRVLLTDKWLPSVIYIQLLSIVGVTRPLSSLYLNIVRATGRVDILMRLELVKQSISLIAMVGGVLTAGVIGLVLGRVISGFINFILNIHYCGREVGVSVSAFIEEIAVTLILTVFMWLLFFLFQTSTEFDNYTQFFGGLFAVPLVYIMFNVTFQKSQLIEVKTIIYENILKIKTLV